MDYYSQRRAELHRYQVAAAHTDYLEQQPAASLSVFTLSTFLLMVPMQPPLKDALVEA